MNDSFEHSVAHAARNRTQVALRRVRNSLYVRARRFFRSVNGKEEKTFDTVAVYPALTDIDKAADLFNRMNWYLGSFDLKGVLPTPHDRPDLRDQLQSIEHQRVYEDTGQVELVSPKYARTEIDRAARLLIWDWKTLFVPSILGRLHKTILVDPHFYSAREVMEWYRELHGKKQRAENRDLNREKFRRIQDSFSNRDEAFVFATGPSLDTVYNYTIPDDALSVICNSIVRNDKLLDYIDPDILTFSDPVFHFGPSEYAAQFRDDVIQMLYEYDCWCIVNTPGDDLLRTQFPQIADRVIGIPGRSNLDRFHIPNASELYVRSTGNIMTLLMLPVAAAFADRISIIGADGREENESYFWEHSSAAQYEGLMNSAVETHPSFFRDRLYDDYYDQHVQELRDIIETQEEQGRAYRSVTPSHIPVLDERR